MHGIDMDNREYVIGIDIGSSNVAMAVGLRNEDKTISVLGVEVQELEGCVKDGDILNYIELGNAIIKAKGALEAELGRSLNSAYVGISGKSVYCVRYEDYVDISDKTGCVTENELRELHSRIEMVVSGGGDVIIDRIPLRYRIDDRQDVKNPLGSYGRKLSATYLFVMAGKQQVDFVNRALYRADIKVSGLCVNPTILPQVLLTDEEKEEGVVVVDLGGDLTDIAVVKEGKLWYFSSLPIGASAINNDLQEFLRTLKKQVDQLKRKYGSAVATLVPDDVTVPVKTAGNARKQILKRNIAEIAEERLKDIAGFVMRELKAIHFLSKVPCGVVLTGGSAYLENIDKLFAREMNMEVRLATLLNGLDYESQQSISAFPQSSVIGLLLYGANHNACETIPKMKEVERVPVIPTLEKPKDIFTVPTNNSAEEVAKEPFYEPIQPQVQEKPIDEDKPEIPSVEEPVVENEEQQQEQQQEQPATVVVEEKSGKEGRGLFGRLRNIADRFRNKVDDMFTDEYL